MAHDICMADFAKGHSVVLDFFSVVCGRVQLLEVIILIPVFCVCAECVCSCENSTGIIIAMWHSQSFFHIAC